MFKELETERLTLREIVVEDAASLFAIFSRSDVVRHYGQDAFQRVEQAEEMIRFFQKIFNEKRGVRWGIELKGTNQLIGTIGYNAWIPKHHRAEIGYELHPGYWGKGYALEAAEKVIAYGFEKMDLYRIGAVVFLENDASNKLLSRLGFEKEGMLRGYMYQEGKPNDTYLYSLLQEKR
ncbi:GNAT family N-acetyltransferase [Bacillus infantis]|uniref:GNAT family N-acetyltransferase n=1 Tax=Bacillus infantis TaxID=324767 RepID=UPI0021552FD0|nr:GNAT family protein [Bacillus infantis]MCR6611166.1 GNAT family N-acetyltransferase [Bacillus infantis]